MCIVAEEIGELIDFSLIVSPFSYSDSLAESVQVSSCREVVLVVQAVEQRQGSGPLDAVMLGQVVQLVLVGGHVVGCGVRSVVGSSSVSALS